MRWTTAMSFLAMLLPAVWAAGCRKPVYFPTREIALVGGRVDARAYDTDGDETADYFTFRNAAGRVDRVGYDRDGDGAPDEVVPLDSIDFAACRHLVLILDGVGYELIKRYYDEGNLRLMHPPSRVIAPYPTLTDVCMEDIFGYLPSRGFEAEYYDHRAGKLVGGSRSYLRGENAPYNRLLHYRGNLVLDAVSYVMPWAVFGKEVNDSKRLFDKRRTQEFRAYYASSAGMSTSKGADGQRMCLQRIEQLVNQVVWESRGLTKVTLLADHGHSYTPARRADLEACLKQRGWRIAERLGGEKDVAYVRFGLETYASFATERPAELAGDVLDCEGVELASFAENDTAVVLAPGGGRAVISHRAGRFRYAAVSGDPLRLKDILAKLTPDADGYYDAGDLLDATTLHVYPAPLQRLWRAHFAQVEDPADVIVSLADEYFSGSARFAAFTTVASTHGSLNHRNSTTFIMSTAGPLPPVMQSRDIPRHMRTLTGAAWPGGK